MKLFAFIARALIVVAILTGLLTGWHMYRNRQRLETFRASFCSLDLPPETDQARCHSAMGILTPYGGDHCDYLAWMQLYTDATPAEAERHFSQLSIAATDGSSRIAPEVYVGTVPPPGERARKLHVRVMDVGHEPGLDPSCRIYGVN